MFHLQLMSYDQKGDKEPLQYSLSVQECLYGMSSVFFRCFEGLKRSQIFEWLLKIQQNVAAYPPPKYTKTSLHGYLSMQMK